LEALSYVLKLRTGHAMVTVHLTWNVITYVGREKSDNKKTKKHIK
jgi:hypothetical protein